MLRKSLLCILLLSLALIQSTLASALRTFDTHKVRATSSLDGLWDFSLPEADSSLAAHTAKITGGRLQVPAVWEKVPGLENYRGKAVYETEIEAVPGKAVRLLFGGVSHTGDVFIDGKKYGHHYDAYTPWAVVAADLQPGTHRLKVVVDNSFGDHSALHTENDYYTWGGITRPVELQQVPYLHITRIHAVPERQSGGDWTLEIKVTLANSGPTRRSGSIAVSLESGARLELGEVSVEPGQSSVVVGRMECPGVIPWSVNNPRLYFLSAELSGSDGNPSDDLIDRVGFREVKVSGGKILVNGESVRLRGFCRHESHPAFGCAIPVGAMYTDLVLLRDMGSNFVRTSHYPNDMRFLDLCNELGIYVWEESHARAIEFDQPKFMEQITGSTTEMVGWHFNHPSIIMWGSLNECHSESPEGSEVYAYVLGLIKKLDPHRPVTFASNRRQNDISLKYADIVSWNLYTGWYGGDLEGIGPFLDALLAWQQTPESGAAGKPTIISEFGAGALYGYRDPARPKWSEEYQADLLGASLEVYLNHPAVSGVAIWQFCDIRITDGWWRTRPRTMNNKGVVDQFRRPKLSYQVVKEKMLEARERWEK